MVKQPTATPKKRAAVMPARPSAHHAQHAKPSVRLCSSGVVAVAAYIYAKEKVAQAGQDELLALSSATQTSTPRATNHRSLNGPVATPGKLLTGEPPCCRSPFMGICVFDFCASSGPFACMVSCYTPGPKIWLGSLLILRRKRLQ